MENANLNINGKEIKKEDFDKALLMFKEKFGDLDGNSVPDILDSLEKKGIQGKILAGIAKSYLQNNNISTESIVTVIEEKANKFEDVLVNKQKTNAFVPTVKDMKSENVTITNSFSKSINAKANVPFPNTFKLDMDPLKSKQNSLKMGNRPFGSVLVYLAIAGVVTLVIYSVKSSFGF